MKHFYSPFKTAGTVLSLFIFNPAWTQSPTTVVESHTCAVVQDFNTTNGNFTSPSLWSDQYDYEFDWTGAGPNGKMVSSSAATFAPYEASLISPQILNTSPDGTASVGFTYSAPAGTLYRIRVIRPNTSGGGDILALTSQGPPVAGGNPNWRPLPSAQGTICLQLLDGDLHPGQNLRFEFTFYVISTSSNVTFDNFALSNVSGAPLPVTFQGIIVERDNSSVNLKWDVGTEINVKNYEVERSEDARSFTIAGTVTAKNKSIYGFNDAFAGKGVVYYRIKNVDVDGQAKYSPIIKLVSANSYSKNLNIYPSPAHDQITIQRDQSNVRAKVTISTIDGKTVKIVTPDAGISNTVIDISNFNPGMFILRLDDGNGKIKATTFIKQ